MAVFGYLYREEIKEVVTKSLNKDNENKFLSTTNQDNVTQDSDNSQSLEENNYNNEQTEENSESNNTEEAMNTSFLSRSPQENNNNYNDIDNNENIDTDESVYSSVEGEQIYNEETSNMISEDNKNIVNYQFDEKYGEENNNEDYTITNENIDSDYVEIKRQKHCFNGVCLCVSMAGTMLVGGAIGIGLYKFTQVFDSCFGEKKKTSHHMLINVNLQWHTCHRRAMQQPQQL